jgi:hypothetical protein
MLVEFCEEFISLCGLHDLRGREREKGGEIRGGGSK